MASPTRSSEEEWEVEEYDLDWEDAEWLHEEVQHLAWTDAFRAGNTTMQMCATCGRTTKAKITLDQWVFAPLICRDCIRML